MRPGLSRRRSRDRVPSLAFGPTCELSVRRRRDSHGTPRNHAGRTTEALPSGRGPTARSACGRSPAVRSAVLSDRLAEGEQRPPGSIAHLGEHTVQGAGAEVHAPARYRADTRRHRPRVVEGPRRAVAIVTVEVTLLHRQLVAGRLPVVAVPHTVEALVECVPEEPDVRIGMGTGKRRSGHVVVSDVRAAVARRYGIATFELAVEGADREPPPVKLDGRAGDRVELEQAVPEPPRAPPPE